jgi:hypothetical protein
MRDIVKFTLQSNPMVHTPGLLKWAMDGYRSRKGRKNLREVFKSYNLSDKCVNDLLSGKIPYEVIEETVVFEYDKSGYEPPLNDVLIALKDLLQLFEDKNKEDIQNSHDFVGEQPCPGCPLCKAREILKFN